MHTKDLILQTAKELISEVGFHRTTTAQLAKKAGISEGTIYRHFESKEDILLAILKELEENYKRFISRLTAEGICERGVQPCLESHFGFVEDNAQDLKIVLATYGILDPSKKSMAGFVNAMTDFFSGCLKSARSAGLINDVAIHENALAITVFLFGLMRIKLWWPDLDSEAFSNEAVQFCRRALGAA